MNRDQAVALVGYRLGRVASLDTLIPAEMEVVQAALEQAEQLYWFLQGEDDLTCSVASRDVLVPTGFLREVEDPHPLWYYPSGGGTPRILPKVWYDRGVAKYGVQTGEPECYALVGDRYKLFPIPDAGYTLHAFFFQKAAALSSGGDTNAWLSEAPDLYIAATVVKMGTYAKDTEAIGLAQGEVTEAKRRLWIAHEARENASMIHQMRTT